jgi:hypothetical protein
MIYWPTKAPGDSIDYGMDWGPTLSKMDDLTITNSEWAVVSGDVTLPANAIAAGSRGTIVRVADGTDGSEAIVRNTVTLSDGQTIHEEAFIKIRAL